MSRILYNLFLFLYAAGVRLASLWSGKAVKWLRGRKQIIPQIKNKLAAGSTANNNTGSLWMHCASLGEFEQGRPLLEALKSANPQLKVVLTFFSPSGYEVMKDYKGVDHVFYLPMDSPRNARRFVDAVNPALVLWVKYEYWFYYLSTIKSRNIPVILVSGIFRPHQPFFRWYGKIWREMLHAFTHFFVQNDESAQLLGGLGFADKVTINGDTRFDRVIEIAGNFKEVDGIAAFCGNNQVLVAGSTWEEDEIELMHFVHVHPEIKFIIAPHEVNKTNLADVKDEFPHSVFYSELIARQGSNENEQATPNVLIIDNIGMLSRIYRYAHIAYVGGGFGADGVHNVLEPAVYGKPVIFGPEYEKYYEAAGLIEVGGAASIDGPISLEAELDRLFANDVKREEMGKAARRYVFENEGASQKIVQFIQENRLLTNR